ncbi:MAG: hypothetical protein M3357_10630 [Actinomycetota bacterium]|nr:hypothetical protein [Actinomycetota bacterium]
MIGRRAGARLLLPAILLTVLAASAGPQATPAMAATTLEVTAGHNGFHVPGRALPVRVTVTADRLVHGDLAILAPGRDEPVVTLPVEVAGGSVKRFLLVVPGGVSESSRALQVELRQNGRAVGRGRAEPRSAGDAELVGLGPALTQGKLLPGTAALAVDVGVARFAPVDAALMAVPGALDSLSTVGLAAGELAALAPSARTGLLRWLADGGHLLLDDGIGTPVDGLPAEWQPGATGRAVAGRGEIRLTAGAMAAGRWPGLVEPTRLGRPPGPDMFSESSVADSMAGDAGLRLPRLAWLLGFLGVYVLVVGPLTAVVLRRLRRPELAWVAVPALAVAFTVLAYAAGNQLRPGSGLAHTSLLETDSRGAVATTWIGFTRRQAGPATVDLPAGWALEPTGSDGFGGMPASGPGQAGVEARLQLDSGEFGFLKAGGPVPLRGRLEVTAATPADGQAAGTVRNGLPFALDHVVVFAGPGRAEVGRLDPGEQRDWSTGPDQQFFDPSGFDVWARTQQFPVSDDSPVNLALWQSSHQDLGLEPGGPGRALAVGWTRDWRPAVTIDGEQRAAPGRTAVLGASPVTAAPGRVTDLAVRREVVRGPFPGIFGWDGNFRPGDSTVVKFTLPAGVSTDRRLVLRSGLSASDVSVWQDGTWQPQPVFGVGGIGMGPGVVIDDLKRRLIIGGQGNLVLPDPQPPSFNLPDPAGPQTTTTFSAPIPAVPRPLPIPPPAF